MNTSVTTTEHQLPTQAQVSKRAYQIYLEHYSQPGHDIDDWLQAEYELMRLPVHKIAELQPRATGKRTRHALVALVQAAMVLGTTGLTQIGR
jgi:hypothetical protein